MMMSGTSRWRLGLVGCLGFAAALLTVIMLSFDTGHAETSVAEA